jgi:sugar/nucleoside kinase (ribokinase family)
VRAELAVVGNAAIDYIDDRPPRVGGGPFHSGQGLRLLERPGLILAKCAPSDRVLVLAGLTPIGVPVTLVDAAKTAEFGLLYDGEVRQTEMREVGDPWTPADLEALGSIAWVHVAPLARSDFPAETLAALARTRRISYDGQGLVRAAREGPVQLDDGFDPDVLRHLSFLKLAEEEAAVILDDIGEGALRSLGVAEVVVTLGSRGSIVCAEGIYEHVPCHPILDVELTGCGDAFGVGYLAARSDGLNPVAAARRATALVAMLLTERKRARAGTRRARR